MKDIGSLKIQTASLDFQSCNMIIFISSKQDWQYIHMQDTKEKHTNKIIKKNIRIT